MQLLLKITKDAFLTDNGDWKIKHMSEEHNVDFSSRLVKKIVANQHQRRELIEFIKKNNPTLNEINHRSFDIVMSGK